MDTRSDKETILLGKSKRSRKSCCIVPAMMEQKRIRQAQRRRSLLIWISQDNTNAAPPKS
jgi:hypothetical protein